MPVFDTGVTAYVKAYAVVEVNFPVDAKGNADIACVRCPYLSGNNRVCQLNKKPVAYPERFIGADCPLERKEGEKT